MQFNRTLFNRTADAGDFSWVGVANAVATASADMSLTDYFMARADAVAAADAKFEGEYHFIGIAEGVGDSEADQIRKRYPAGKADAIATAVVGGLYIIGNEFLDLEGVDLHAGDDLEIDTGRMTLTINQRNAVYALSDDSTFFKLAKGDQIIVDGNGTAAITLLWKDRWLG